MVRRLIHLLVAGASLVLLVRAVVVQGLVVPIRVAGPSMAEAVRGPHRSVHCTSCGLTFACDLLSPPPRGAGRCSNCGQGELAVERFAAQPGDRLLVVPAAFALRGPRRWELVVLRCPHNPRELCVKRVVGLPGERVELRAGDAWIDGQPAPRPWAVFREMAVLVFDDTHRGRSAAARWVDDGGQWRATERGYEVRPGEEPEREHVLRYWPAEGGGGRATGGPAVRDDLAYNQGESRVLLGVDDLACEGLLRAEGDGTLALRLPSGAGDCEAWIDLASGRCRLHLDRALVGEFALGPRPFARARAFAWARYDNQAVLAIDGQLACTAELLPRPRGGGSGAAGPAIVARGARVAVEALRLWRDVYYRPGAGLADPGAERTWRLGPGEYFLLGDNSPASQDSRSWPQAGVPGGAIVGKAVVIAGYR